MGWSVPWFVFLVFKLRVLLFGKAAHRFVVVNVTSNAERHLWDPNMLCGVRWVSFQSRLTPWLVVLIVTAFVSLRGHAAKVPRQIVLIREAREHSE